jgi:Cdc6-like AAA superfamily ATPase
MAVIDQTVVTDYINAGAAAKTTTAKGRALEDLICYVFELVPGITMTQRNTKNVFLTEEIDVAFFNNGPADGFIALPNIIFIEAKNWSSKLGSSEVSWFNAKVESRGMSFGIMITPLGITGNQNQKTGAYKIISDALRAGRRLVVIRLDELQALTDTTQLVELVKRKILELVLKGGLV